MPAYARCEIVDESVVGIYHCTSRCVRRAFLCGDDPASGRNFEHRKAWLRERLEALAGVFAIDILGFAVLSNHLHLLLRNRPDVAGQMSDEEVASRWQRIFFRSAEADARAEPDERKLAMLLADGEGVAERRRRLSSISWFMRALCEPIARLANREDGAAGRFWEGRFKCQAVLDEAAVLASSIYVDLNPIRAGIAETPETSQYTGAFERIAATRQAAKRGSASSAPRRDDWLSPIADDDARQVEDRQAGASQAGASLHSSRRASDRGFLPLSLDDYLALLDWTGRQLRADKRGSIPAELRPILERLSINADGWAENMLDFGRQFRRVIGRAASISDFARQRGRRWFQGQAASRLAFS